MSNLYPWPLPEDIQQWRALTLSSAGAYTNSFHRQGTYVQFRVVTPHGDTYWTSHLIAVTQLPDVVSLDIHWKSKGWSVRMDIYVYPAKGVRILRSSIRVPFVFAVTTKRSTPVAIKVATKTSAFRRQLAIAKTRARMSLKGPPIRRVRIPSGKRANSESSTRTVLYRQYNNATLYLSTPVTFTDYLRTWSGTTTPGFGALKRRGKLPINNYSMDLYMVEDGGASESMVDETNPGSDSFKFGPYSHFMGGSEFGVGPSGLSSNSTVEDRAVHKLIASANNTGNGIALNLAQINQTVSMIGLTASRISGSLSALRRGNFSKAVSLLTRSRRLSYRFGRRGKALSTSLTLAENWLELQYGWKPLLNDLDDTMRSLAKLNLGNVRPETARSTATGERVDVSELHLNVTGQARTGTRIEFSTWECRYGMRYVVDSHFISFIAQSGFTTPVDLGWELLPFSFVADWFLPIGPYLETLSAWHGLSFESGWKSVLNRKITYSDCYYSGSASPTNPNETRVYTAMGNFRCEQVHYGRSKLTSFPTVGPPQFKNPLSVGHALNAVALLVANFKK